MPPKFGTLEERFLINVKIGSPDQCWPWLGGRNGQGYAYIRREKGGKVPVHRYAYERHHGITLPFGRSVIIMHACDNPICCNPGHLRAGTIRDNIADMDSKGRRAVGKRLRIAVLTPRLVVKYRKQFAEGRRLRDIAKESGIDKGTLRAMRDRRTWKHVP